MAIPAPTPIEHSNGAATGVLFVTVVIDLIGFGIVLPLLPGYAAQFHASETAIGALVGSFSLMQFLLAPWWGRLSDRIGRRPVLLIGLAGSASSYLLFALAGNFWVLLLSRMLAGGMGATVNVAQAYLADITPLERRARAMGLIGAAFGLGFVLGPAIAGFTIRLGHRAPGLFAAGISFAALTLAAFRLPETRIHRVSAGIQPMGAWRGLAGPSAVLFLITLAFTVMNVVFPLYVVRSLGYDQRTTSYCFVLLGLVATLVQGWLIGKLTRRFTEHALMIAGGAILAAGLLLVPISQAQAIHLHGQLAGMIGALVLIATGSSLANPSITGYVSRITPAAHQGASLGTLQSVGAIARIVGPPATGFLTQVAGVRFPFFAGSLISLAAMVTAVGVRGASDVPIIEKA